ncbi:MBL fold metallo-hydrolase [Hyphomonas johnsonii]|uniref:Metallo-beta-lactamase family protein n=1 Tax=Hyphomonas johnsonii MHS-2 TaxID=1280950 RepID=A0A059FE69_9PROT|nr:MBL fold metallo-hydrolase [Hyphomonas johnsonii]KCZ88914.1 metallo-beta-lactamase family protein [Hyphomonas johnsonii MHS-2]
MAIPYVRGIEFEYGVVQQVSPLIRRVIANNPGPFTYVGTGVYIVGKGEVAVIDPGPMDETHFDALKAALEGETVTHVLVSHGHSDHSPLAAPLAEWAGCKTYAKNCGVLTAKGELGSADDLGFVPDVRVGDGDSFSGPGWTLDAIETPGHTCNHLCFALREENACFSGDHIMGWSTTVVAPPDGDMADYMASLEKIRMRGFETLWPTHGDPVRGKAFVEEFITEYANHRRAREASILEHLGKGETSIPAMVEIMYANVEKRLHPAAAMSVLGHMMALIREGRVYSPDAAPTVRSRFELVRSAS